MTTKVKCGFPNCDWNYKNEKLESEETDYLIVKLFIHYIEKHAVPKPKWEFYVE